MATKKELKAQILYLERRLAITELEWSERYKRLDNDWHVRTQMLREQFNNLVTLKAQAAMLIPPTYIAMDLAGKEDKKIKDSFTAGR